MLSKTSNSCIILFIILKLDISMSFLYNLAFKKAYLLNEISVSRRNVLNSD